MVISIPDSRNNYSGFFVPPAAKISMYVGAKSFPSFLYLWNNDSANNVLSAILINRAVSVLDIILRSINVSVSTESNFNEINKYGINKINFSIGLN